MDVAVSHSFHYYTSISHHTLI